MLMFDLYRQFLRATAYTGMLSAHILTQCPPSVCSSIRLSVTRADQSKTVEAKIIQFSLYSSPIPLVFARQVSSGNSDGFTPSEGLNETGVGKIRNF